MAEGVPWELVISPIPWRCSVIMDGSKHLELWNGVGFQWICVLSRHAVLFVKLDWFKGRSVSATDSRPLRIPWHPRLMLIIMNWVTIYGPTSSKVRDHPWSSFWCPVVVPVMLWSGLGVWSLQKPHNWHHFSCCAFCEEGHDSMRARVSMSLEKQVTQGQFPLERGAPEYLRSFQWFLYCYLAHQSRH